MVGLGRLGQSYAAVASAGVMLFAVIQYQSQLSRSQPWPTPRIEFQWQPELRTSMTSVAVPRMPARSLIAALRPLPKTERASSGLRRLLPPPLAATRPPVRPVARQTSADARGAEARLKENLTRELYGSFKLFLYVSKAQNGPLAQHMYVFDKTRRGGLQLLYDWPVSTGREQTEADLTGTDVSTGTPSGYYELDPRRFYTHHVSAEWHEPMPYAMFLNWVKEGSKTGLAIHAATGNDIAELGARASAGCIRLAPEEARTLFSLIRDRYRGRVPRFVIDPQSHTMSTDGMVLRDRKGRVEVAPGYKVLVVIENYGGNNVVAMF